MKIGDWVLVYFPADDSGKQRKLSRPWHGPYRVVSKDDTNITASKVYFPDQKNIKVHQSRVQMCPLNFPAGYHWYGNKRTSPGRPPKWVDQLLARSDGSDTEDLDGMTDSHDQDSDEDAEDTSTQQESEVHTQVCDAPVAAASHPTQRTRTRVVKPPSRYS